MDELGRAEPIVLVASRDKHFALTALLLGVVFGGVLLVVEGRLALGLIISVLFGVLSVYGVAATLRPPRLTIDRDGFTVEAPWRRHHYEFDDCGEFGVAPSPAPFGRGTVVFGWTRPAGAGSEVVHRTVSGLFETSEDELAELLNRRRSATDDGQG